MVKVSLQLLTQPAPEGCPISSRGSSSQSDRSELELVLNRRSASLTLLALLVAAAITLVALDVWISFGRVITDQRIRNVFSLRAEDSLGTWFSSMQLLMLAVVLGVTLHHGRQASPRRPAWWAAGWLGIICLYFSVDEVAQIHERLGRLIRRSGLADSYPSYHWHLALTPILLITAALIVLLLVNDLSSSRARLLVSSGLVLWMIAVGVDFLEGYPGAYAWLAGTTPLSARSVSHFSRVVEELFEMLGSSLLLTGFLTDLFDRVDRVAVELV